MSCLGLRFHWGPELSYGYYELSAILTHRAQSALWNFVRCPQQYLYVELISRSTERILVFLSSMQHHCA